VNADKKKQAQGMDAAQFGQDAQKNQNQRVAQKKALPLGWAFKSKQAKTP